MRFVPHEDDAWEVAVDPQYYVQRKMAEADEIGLRQRRLHARLLADARSSSLLPPPGRWSSVRRVVTLLTRSRSRRATARDRIALTMTEPAAPMASPDAGALQAAAATAEVAINAMLEMTEAICRLPDGSTGRIAIERRADDTWAAICVVTPRAGRPADHSMVTDPSLGLDPP